jgi:DNA-binding transcriptional regulator YdaS (Cro superfamily)
MNRLLKAKIVEVFGSQADFAQEINVDESIVSRVIRGRRTLSPTGREKWCKVLKCDPSIIEGQVKA